MTHIEVKEKKDERGKCPQCNGVGFTSEHDLPSNHAPNGDCISCPIQVQCEVCEATGIILSSNSKQ